MAQFEGTIRSIGHQKLERNRYQSERDQAEIVLETSSPSRPVEETPLINSVHNSYNIAMANFSTQLELKSRNNFADLFTEYKSMCSDAKTQQGLLKLTSNVGTSDANLSKNRFNNIFPYDQNRVIIKEKSKTDYINASWIPRIEEKGESSGSSSEYLASQGPIETSIDDFWLMIWSEDVHFIVMLTRTVENEKFKCLQYWPDDVDQTISYGKKKQFVVKLAKETLCDGFYERVFDIRNKICMTSKTLVQLHMHTWLDHSTPDLNMFDQFNFRFHELTVGQANTPVLVHCSAGVGRTGTFITIDRIVKALISGSETVNVYDTVLNLRKYRMMMVQKQSQYVFIYEYINHFLQKYLQKSRDDPIYFNEDAE